MFYIALFVFLECKQGIYRTFLYTYNSQFCFYLFHTNWKAVKLAIEDIWCIKVFKKIINNFNRGWMRSVYKGEHLKDMCTNYIEIKLINSVEKLLFIDRKLGKLSIRGALCEKWLHNIILYLGDWVMKSESRYYN